MAVLRCAVLLLACFAGGCTKAGASGGTWKTAATDEKASERPRWRDDGATRIFDPSATAPNVYVFCDGPNRVYASANGLFALPDARCGETPAASAEPSE